MRPRRYCRGDEAKAADGRLTDSRFNEAAALLPRRFPQIVDVITPTVKGFNEAAALLPRRFADTAGFFVLAS